MLRSFLLLPRSVLSQCSCTFEPELPFTFTCSVAMLIKVKTLTGKEIELDIEPNDKVERIKEKACFAVF